MAIPPGLAIPYVPSVSTKHMQDLWTCAGIFEYQSADRLAIGRAHIRGPDIQWIAQDSWGQQMQPYPNLYTSARDIIIHLSRRFRSYFISSRQS